MWELKEKLVGEVLKELKDGEVLKVLVVPWAFKENQVKPVYKEKWVSKVYKVLLVNLVIEALVVLKELRELKDQVLEEPKVYKDIKEKLVLLVSLLQLVKKANLVI